MRKLLFKFHYPKLILLALSIILAYFLFTLPSFTASISSFGEENGYLTTFIAGFLFSFGFTTPFAVGFFMTYNPSSIILASAVAALGAVISDYLLFKLIRFSFMDEIMRLERARSFKKTENFVLSFFPSTFKLHMMYVVAGFMIASPLPDEIGVAMIAGTKSVKIEKFVILSFIMKFIGVLFFFIL